MRVLVDALSVHFGGGQTFALEQLGGLRRMRPDLALHVLLAPWNVDALDAPLTAAGCRTEVVSVGSLPQRWAWQEVALPRQARGYDLLYAPGNFLPLRRLSTPTVVCQQNPNYTPEAGVMAHNRPAGRRWRIAQAYRSMRVATRTVVVAHWMLASMARDVPGLRRTGVAIHSGVPGWPAAPVPVPELERAEYLLLLSNDAPHKDLDLLVSAWGDAAAADLAMPDLALAGDLSPTRIAEHRALVPDSVRPRLRHLGAVRDRAQVRWVLEHARAMVSASRLESCPLTILEARSLDCPLVLSETPSHVEAAAEVARFAPVGDRVALAAALADPPARVTQHFRWTTWDEHAVALGAVFDAAVQGGPVEGGR